MLTLEVHLHLAGISSNTHINLPAAGIAEKQDKWANIFKYNLYFYYSSC